METLRMTQITFVLPGYSREPIGGYKIVFMYANYLAKSHDVCILFLNSNALIRYPLPELIRVKAIDLFTQQNPKWFKLNPRIKKISARNKKDLYSLKDTDIVIATAATTVNFVKRHFNSAKKFYLIQDFENWDIDDKELYATYSLGLRNIVVSQWLKEIVDEYSDRPSAYIRNPIDTQKYIINNPISNRDPYTVGMLYHTRPTKGSKYSLEAIKQAKTFYPELKVEMFGACPPPDALPEWITYFENASQDRTIRIYNDISIFINGTIEEGFGLTGLEAMACGAALVSTNYLGVKEYAVDRKNALLSPVKDSTALSKNLQILFDNDNLRQTLANNGNKTAQSFSLDNAYKEFESIILS